MVKKAPCRSELDPNIIESKLDPKKIFLKKEPKNYEKILNKNKNYNLMHDNGIFNAEKIKLRANESRCSERRCFFGLCR